MSLHGRIAVITGGASGIGLAISQRLARNGASVAVFDVESSSALTETQKRRVVTRAGPVLRAVAQDERSRARNRELALERLEHVRDVRVAVQLLQVERQALRRRHQ